MDNFIRGKVLGKGSFGSAILVTSKKDGKQFVIKEIDISRMPPNERVAAKQEAQLLMALKHPNIVRCYDTFTDNNKMCIVMELCSEGDIYGILQKRKTQQLPEDTILDWFVQMCLGLKHVHDRKILHRDIKTQNVFMSSGGLLKLGDFGVSKILSSTWQLAGTAVGTPYYLSPEICQNKRYNQKSDIWSLGCVLYELSTMKHAFEAPNMRALIQKIIKASYPPVPSTRSKELRDLIDRMLTLDMAKRPSINDILATPVMKQRIQKFLSSTLQAHEFSHTVIHGKPRPGQLVVTHAAALPAPAFADSPGKAAAPAPALRAPTAAAAAQRIGAAVALPAGSPARPPVAAGSPARGQLPAASPAAARVPGAAGGSPARPSPGGASPARQAAGAAAAAAGSPARPPAGAAAAAAAGSPSRLAPAAAAPGPVAAALAARQRDEAAARAQREVERLKLEEQRTKLEQDKVRLEADKRRAEAKRTEDERRAKAGEEARLKAAAEEERRQREADGKRKKAEEEARKRDAERQARDKERDDMRAKIAAQKQDYMDRQEAAAKNRAAAEQQIRGPVVAVPKPRKQWQDVQEPAAGLGPSADEVVEPAWQVREPQQRGKDELSAEQRRAVWEEQKAAAARNRQQAGAEADRGGGGLAAFLGVPQPEPAKAEFIPKDGRPGSSEEERRQAYLEMKAAAERNRRQAEGDRQQPYNAAAPAARDGDFYERKKNKLEEERGRREAEILEFQRQHYREMKDAAERNRRQIQQDIGVGPGAQPRPASDDKRKDQEQEAEENGDFAAMVKDMQDLLTDSDKQAAAADAVVAEDGDGEEGNDDWQAEVLSGCFMLNGEVVSLPVQPTDPLGVKVEALRVFLEAKLGAGPFVKVYRRLESLSADDDEAEVSREFLAILGQAKLPYLQLVHQLIVCEEQWAGEAHKGG